MKGRLAALGGAPERALGPLESLKIDYGRESPAWFNVPENYQSAVAVALGAGP